MKKIVAFFQILGFVLCSALVFGQNKKPERLIIVTIDGLRWQEVFKGLDNEIIANPDTKGNLKNIKTLYPNREAIMPFFWNELSKKAAFYGNRDQQSDVKVSNPYHFSYPGYAELLSGWVDEKVNSNNYPENTNLNILDILQSKKLYENQIVAFGAWNAFARIFHKSTSKFPVFEAFSTYKNDKSANVDLLNSMLKNSHKPWLGNEALDIFTHTMAMDYLKTQKPKVAFIGYGETDEWAHSENYRYYLDAMKNTDQFLSEIWNFIQTTPEYKDNTILLITTDHGRGSAKSWGDHGSDVPGADEIWFALYYPQLKSTGEIKTSKTIYLKELSPTLLRLMGIDSKELSPKTEFVKELL